MEHNTRISEAADHPLSKGAARLRMVALHRMAIAGRHRRENPAATGRAGEGRRETMTSNLCSAILVLCLQMAPLEFTSDALAQAAAVPAVSCEREIAVAAHRYDIPLAVFYAVGLNETGSKGRLQPFSMNIDGRAATNASLDDALRTFRAAQSKGARMIDIGCMQINHHYHAANFPSLQAMFDPARNIDYAARFLRDLKVREKSWTMAVARYNAGPDNDPAQKRYVCAVLGKMVASGFGAWTEKARAFCQLAPLASLPH